MYQDIKPLILKIQMGTISTFDIPEDLKDDQQIINAERRAGIRISARRGYDVIRNCFFVEEHLFFDDDEYNDIKLFNDFNTYYNYLDGDIYDNACYYQIDPQLLPSTINICKLNQESFIDKTINDYTLLPNKEEWDEYNESEKRKPQIKQWLLKFDKCKTYQDLEKLVFKYEKSALSPYISLSFFFWNYIFKDVNDKTRFQAIMEYMSTGMDPEHEIINGLLDVYNPEEVVANYKYSWGVKATQRRHIKDLKCVAEKVLNDKLKYYEYGYFDSETHYYCVETRAYEGENQTWPTLKYREFFETWEEFVVRLKYDLSSCDLSEEFNFKKDISNCIINESTLLPIKQADDYVYSIKKIYEKSCFRVYQEWKNQFGLTVKEYSHKFNYFCDFVAFLNGDLDNANLLWCDGLLNLQSLQGLKMRGAILSSDIEEKFNLPSKKIDFKALTGESFKVAEQNEKETSLILSSARDMTILPKNLTSMISDSDLSCKYIYYVSDLHLDHLIKNKKCKTMADIVKTIGEVVERLCKNISCSIVLINGDTTSNFEIFKLFAMEIRKHVSTVVFTLGNHEIWSCPDECYDQIVQKYQSFLSSNGMFLLQNNILYFENWYSPHIISTEQIDTYTKKELRDNMKLARLILFGGTGFSGYNPVFNAKAGLYRFNKTIGYDRTTEIAETQKFESLYNKIKTALYDKPVVIMTHMPVPDWYAPASISEEQYVVKRGTAEYNNTDFTSVLEKNFIYISGHTHRNFFYDDGDIRVYADNQFGYNKNNPSAWPYLKYFEINKSIDLFEEWDDGIYEISVDEYKKFYAGKNIMMDLNRPLNILYALKKNGYYCFIHKSEKNSLYILNGGREKKLDYLDIHFYYDNMNQVIRLIQNPLVQYTTVQKQVSDVIKQLGGSGKIHGCIIDIDFLNHIYIDPLDGKITGYYAENIVYKEIYQTIPALIEARCPKLYAEYLKLLQNDLNKNLPAVFSIHSALASQPTIYLDTNIYRASREIKKMQKLQSNILSIWPDKIPKNNLLK